MPFLFQMISAAGGGPALSLGSPQATSLSSLPHRLPMPASPGTQKLAQEHSALLGGNSARQVSSCLCEVQELMFAHPLTQSGKYHHDCGVLFSLTLPHVHSLCLLRVLLTAMTPSLLLQLSRACIQAAVIRPMWAVAQTACMITPKACQREPEWLYQAMLVNWLYMFDMLRANTKSVCNVIACACWFFAGKRASGRWKG